jgi:uncharacterized lipoprotein YajG
MTDVLTQTLIVLGAILLLSGCERPAVSTSQTNNAAVNVQELFTNKGCTVYRFQDGGRAHYFADCRGSTMSTYNCGKGCLRDEEVATNE